MLLACHCHLLHSPCRRLPEPRRLQSAASCQLPTPASLSIGPRKALMLKAFQAQ